MYLAPDGAICQRTFAKSTNMIVHYRQHIKPSPFECKICRISFKQSGPLVRHNIAMHGGDTNVDYFSSVEKQQGAPEEEEKEQR